MSNNTPVNQPNPSDEVDIMQLFNAIGRFFERLFNFIKSIFQGILDIIVMLLKVFIKRFKIIIVALLVAFIVGYLLEKNQKPAYESKMIVRPYFDSKYQLITNIDYFNALIGNENYKTLSDIFSISQEDAKQINGFSIAPGPETENQRIVQYDAFVRSIDSVRAQDISFDDFIENRSIYSGDLFEISVSSYKRDIFANLEDGLNASYTNQYALKKMKKRDSMITIQKQNILEALKEVDSLQKVYVSVIEEESKKEGNLNYNNGFPVTQEKSKTREYELLEKQIRLRDQLSKLDEKKIEEDVFFDTISSFQKIGTRAFSWKQKYSLILPVLTLLGLIFLQAVLSVLSFVKRYSPKVIK